MGAGMTPAPFFAYHGSMDTQKAIHNEFLFALVAGAGALAGKVASDHVKLDERPELSQTRNLADYPWIVFGRIIETPNQQQVDNIRERYYIELIGLKNSTKGAAFLEDIKRIIYTHFSFFKKRIGAYDDDGTPNPAKGVVVRAQYIDTVDATFDGMDEKRLIMQFAFSRIGA